MIDFGLVDAVDAETIGPPGERTFRVRARAGVNHASLWMEKEQLAALGRALSQVLAERSSERGKESEPAPEMGDFQQDVDVEMRIARMGLDFEAEREHVVVLADDSEAVERGDTPAFPHGDHARDGPGADRERPENRGRGPSALPPLRPADGRRWPALLPRRQRPFR